MFILTLTYIAVAVGALIALALMILKIGQMIGDCPKSKGAARAASVTITTGFAAIGGGGIMLIGAVLPVFPETPFAALMFALGFAALCLGLGFTHAVATLRAVIADVMIPTNKTA
ncbi:MAG: hypothetical protein ACI9PY_001191 [Ascidiaceihabitans sp.]|jgi:hypothetical protein